MQQPSFPERTQIFAGLSTGIQGQERIRLNHEQDIAGTLYAGSITLADIDLNLGVNLDLMQELLLRFEQRILDRIDAYETRLMLTLNQNQEQTNKRLDDILELIRWKGDDEAL